LPGGKRVSNSKLYPRKVFSGSELRLIFRLLKSAASQRLAILVAAFIALFFLAGFRAIPLFFPLADGAEGRAFESEFFS
jgi:hypothetical protein